MEDQVGPASADNSGIADISEKLLRQEEAPFTEGLKIPYFTQDLLTPSALGDRRATVLVLVQTTKMIPFLFQD